MTPPSHFASAHEAVAIWASTNQRDLPWRRTRDPWAVLVAEVMLQQTQVVRVIPKWEAFLRAFPAPPACGAADLAEVLDLWHGLGYPRRGRNLWLTAQRCVEHHGGRLPTRLEDLMDLPGIGPYTARAVAVFADEQHHGVVDTNIARVLARVGGHRLTPSRAQRLADELVPEGWPWLWNQALMDIGASYCRPTPTCDECPLRRSCRWWQRGRPDPDPAIGTAHSSGRQSRFEGSDRQGRGRLLAAMRVTAVARSDLAESAGWPNDPQRAQRVVEGLVCDGLVTRVGDRYHLG